MNIQKTATATSTFTGAGNELRIDLGSSSAVNIIQSICVYFSSVVVPISSNKFILSASDGTSILNDFYTNAGNIASGQTVFLGKATQIICPQRYIEMSYLTDATSPNDTVFVSVCYLQIPNSNILSNNFLSFYGTTSLNSQNILNGPAAGCYTIKSIWTSCLSTTASSYKISLNQNSITAPLSAPKTLQVATGQTASGGFLSIYGSGISLGTGSSLLLEQTAAQASSYYISYTYNALDV